MTRYERACQIWSLLVFCARNRQTLDYGLLGRLTGVPAAGLGPMLEPIQSHCILHDLPPLTSLVVDAETGRPGEGFIAAGDLPGAQAETLAFDWLAQPVPDVDAFREAVRQLPSMGLSLSFLLKQIKTPERECR